MFVIVDRQVAFRPCFDNDLVDVAEIGVAEFADASGKANISISRSGPVCIDAEGDEI